MKADSYPVFENFAKAQPRKIAAAWTHSVKLKEAENPTPGAS